MNLPPTPQLSPRDFRQRWSAGAQAAGEVVLLDVREPRELQIAAVDGALHVPMGDIPARIDELDPQRPLVVMCHSGVRSAHVVAFLRARGFDNVYNLTGGIQAWSEELDPTVPVY